MILYSFRRCPYAMRARLALLHAGLNPELREVALRDKPAELLAVSPKGTVPVNICDDGTVLEESMDIMRWALPPHHPWRATDDQDRIAENDGPLKFHLDHAKYGDRYPDEDPDYHRDAAAAILRRWDLRTPTPGITDLAIFPFVRQLVAHDPDWFASLDLPETKRWLDHWCASDLFRRAMRKWPTWAPGQAPVFLDEPTDPAG